MACRHAYGGALAAPNRGATASGIEVNGWLDERGSGVEGETSHRSGWDGIGSDWIKTTCVNGVE